MRTYANKYLARKWLAEVLGDIPIGQDIADEPGMIQFTMPTRFMVLAAHRIKERWPDRYKFDRTSHFIDDTVRIDEYRVLCLRHRFGAQRCTVTLYDWWDDGQSDNMIQMNY